MIDILFSFKNNQTNQPPSTLPPFSVLLMFHVCVLKVLDSNPLPGMMITPSEGVVPVGGHADLKICFTPSAKMSFDTRVEVFKTGRTCLLSVMFCVYVWRCTSEHLLDFISSVLMLFKEKKKFLQQLMAAITYSVILVSVLL